MPLHQTQIENWAQQLKCSPDRFEIAAIIINRYKNFESAMALLFDLPMCDARDYLLQAAKYLRDYYATWPEPKAPLSKEWLASFVTHYKTEVQDYVNH